MWGRRGEYTELAQDAEDTSAPRLAGTVVDGAQAGVQGREGAKLATFDGVFVPCVLSIFGVILFQRLGWIVGQAGMLQFTVMLCVGYLVVITTVLSLSALSTNGQVKGGGAYYLISRALGPELGGAIGLIFYAANVSGCVVYILGFAEELVDVVPNLEHGPWTHTIVALVALTCVTIVCFVGPSLYAKTALAIFAGMSLCLVLTFISFFAQKPEGSFTGIRSTTFESNIHQHYTGKNDFAVVFSILFPAVTGIMAGANMSGQLKEPARSIPIGTLLATLLSVVVYAAFALLIAASNTSDSLTTKDGYTVLRRVSVFPASVSGGIFMAVLSSCMGSEIGGAEILQALAKDGLLPLLSTVFAPRRLEQKDGSGVHSEGGSSNAEDKKFARRSVLATFIIISLCLLTGTNLNEMATFQTLFFLLSYAIINLACFILSIQGSPSFRPIWAHYSWHMAFIGFVACLAVMFYTHPLRASLALLLCLLLIIYLAYRGPPEGGDWGDVTQSLIFHQVRKFLLRLDERKLQAKFWRPQILLLSGNPRAQYRLLSFANNLKKGGLLVLGSILAANPEANVKENEKKREGKGRATAGNVLRGEVEVTHNLIHQLAEIRRGWMDFISASRIKAFPVVTAASSFRAGTQTLLLTSGLGALRPNTVMLEFREDVDIREIRSSVSSLDTLSLPNRRMERLRTSLRKFPPLANMDRKSVDERKPDDSSPPATTECFSEHKSLDEYLRTLDDTLTFGNNLLVARHFPLLPHHLVDGSRAQAKSFTSFFTNSCCREHKSSSTDWGRGRNLSSFSQLEGGINDPGILSVNMELENGADNELGLGDANLTRLVPLPKGKIGAGHMYIDIWCLPESVINSVDTIRESQSTDGLPESLGEAKIHAEETHFSKNVELCLLLGWMLRRSRGQESGWARGSKLRVVGFAETQLDKKKKIRELRQLLRKIRVAHDAIHIVVEDQVNLQDPKCNFRYGDGLCSLAASRTTTIGARSDINLKKRPHSNEEKKATMFMQSPIHETVGTPVGTLVGTPVGSVNDRKKARWLRHGMTREQWYNVIMRSNCKNTAVAFLPFSFDEEQQHNFEVKATECHKPRQFESCSSERMSFMKRRWEELTVLTEGMCPVMFCHVPKRSFDGEN